VIDTDTATATAETLAAPWPTCGPYSRRILIIALAGTDPALLDAVAERANASPADFTVLVPAVARGLHRLVDPEDHGRAEAEATLDAAISALSQAAGAPIAGMIGSHDPFAAAWDALNFGAYDEVIVSAPSSRVARWLHVDLPRKIESLGVRVTTALAGEKTGPLAPQPRRDSLQEPAQLLGERTGVVVGRPLAGGEPAMVAGEDGRFDAE
jgi:hypothetical protein